VTTQSSQQLREEFNRWAEADRGEGMENDHLPIVLPMLAMMNIQPDEQILDVGCGTGWLPRLLARRVTEGGVAGMDVSDEMIHRAEASSAGVPNVSFMMGSVEAIPQPDSRFSRVISVESAYYWPQPEAGLRDIHRVLRPGGSFWMLINYYRDNPYCHQWAQHYAIPTHLLSADEWAGLFRHAGFTGVSHRRIPDPTPTPEVYTGRWFRDAGELRRFRDEGALLVFGGRPVSA
jgi:ubiquinone/menaquinone biosynthesis C-methylase UbiE